MIIVGLIIGLALGVALGFLVARSRHQDELTNLREQNATLNAQLVAQQAEHVKAEELLTARFQQMSNELLKSTSEQLVQTAEQTLKKAHAEAKGELDQNRLKIEHMVEPMRDNLAKLEQFIQTSNSERKAEFGGLREQLKSVAMTNQQIKDEAAQLSNVLRSSSSARGRWGEMQLKRVVELAGMAEHCDFVEQKGADGADNNGRADMIVTLPGDRTIAIDAKVPFEAFERAANTTDPDEQRALYVEHARKLRGAVDQLAKRKYWEQYKNSVDHCILFVPGEGLLQAALMHDPQLADYAMEKRVMLVSPTILVTTLRGAATQWQQQRQVENAAQIASVGKELYNRLIKMMSYVSNMGTNLNRTVNSYNEMIGSYEARVIPQSRKLSEMGVGDGEVIELDVVESSPRELKNEAPALLPTRPSQAKALPETFEQWWGAKEADGS